MHNCPECGKTCSCGNEDPNNREFDDCTHYLNPECARGKSDEDEEYSELETV